MFCIVVRDVEDKNSPRPASQDEDVINKINSTKKRDFGPFMNTDRTNFIVPRLFRRLLSASEPLAINPSLITYHL